MPLNTDKLKLQYLAQNEPLTHQMENIRYTTIDVQFEALASVLGSGVIDGWNITNQLPAKSDGTIPKTPPSTVYISPGNGNINCLFAESLLWTTVTLTNIGTPDNPAINYIYAGITNNTPLTKEVRFLTSLIELNQSDLIPLGYVSIYQEIGSTTQVISIDTSAKKDIGFLTKFLSLLLQHRHGKDGIAPIDLATEVKGFLSSANIGDIPAERITSGIIDPQRIIVDHLNLLNGGELSHNDLDSAVKMLQKTNKKLFGDISTANLLQLIAASKQSVINIDRTFRNLIIIIPGIDNNTFSNSKSFLEPEYVHEKNLYEEGIETYDLDGEEIYIKKDASIVDFNESVIYGRLASGLSIHETNIDNPVEFRNGNYDSSFIEIKNILDTNDYNYGYGYVYGYGYGYGQGLDFFDVFGIASGVTNPYGEEYHSGYGVSDFENLFINTYGYGYGTELISGTNPFLPGRALVTLKQNPSDVKLYRYDFQDGNPDSTPSTFDTNRWIDYVSDDDFGISLNSKENIELINDIKIYNKIMERTEYTRIPSSETGNVAGTFVSNRRLVYLLNPDDTSYSNRTDWTNYKTFQIKISPSDLDAKGIWYLRVYSEKLVGTVYSTVASAPFLLINNNFSSPVGEEKILTVDVDAIVASNADFNRSRITKIEIFDPNILEITYPETKLIPWAQEIDEIGLTGGYTYSKVDANNTIDKLYIVIPFNPAAELKNISWVGEEPSDSRLLFYIRNIDANNSNTDGFQLLENASFGNAYTNKANLYVGDPITSIRPSGSDVTEGDATHVEIKVILQPSVDGTTAPSLNSITLRYSVAGQDEEIVLNSDELFNIDTVNNTQRTNIVLNQNSDLTIKRIKDIGIRSFGLKNKFEQVKKNDNFSFLYNLINNPNNNGRNTIKTNDNYIQNKEAGYGRISAIKKNSDGNLILCDTTNHRLVCVKAETNELIWALSGITANTNQSSKLYPTFAHFNTNENIIYIGFSRVISNVSSINNSFLNGTFISDNNSNKTFTTGVNGDVVDVVYASNNVNKVSNLIRIKLSQSTISKINSLDSNISLLINGVPFGADGTETFKIPIEKINVYYAHINYPIDLKVDNNNNILFAQVTPKEVENDQIIRNDSFNSIIKFNTSNLDIYNEENILNKWNYSINQGNNTFFDFDINYCGSVEEIIDENGDQELLIADIKNQRVLRITYDNSEVTWQLDKNGIGGIYSIPSNLYPTCATRGANGLFYITLTDILSDNPTGEDSKIIEVNNNYQLTKTLLGGKVKNPQDVSYLEGNRILISS